MVKEKEKYPGSNVEEASKDIGHKAPRLVPAAQVTSVKNEIRQ